MRYLLMGILVCLGIFIVCTTSAKPGKVLLACWKKQAKALNRQSIHLQYSQAKNMLYHSMKPWQTYARKTTGNVWVDNSSFSYIDTFAGRKSKLCSKIYYTPSCLLEQSYGDTSLEAVSKEDLNNELFFTARYNPGMLIDHFYKARPQQTHSSDGIYTIYKLIINKTFTSLYINNNSKLLEKLVMMNDDDMYGDVVNTIYYKDYKPIAGLYIPHTIFVEKTNDKARDTIIISQAELVAQVNPILHKPEHYKLREELPDDGIKTIRYNDHISFIQFNKAASQAAIISFKYFTVIVDAPLKSANGSQLLQEAARLNPGKPVKYFTFGHHHPWYLGGVRPFINAGIPIISTAEDTSYINYLANAAHTINPDELQHGHKPPVYDILQDSTTISDGSYEIKLYHLGERSDHTSDYTVYYFPAEKLLFEDDLVWINNTSELKKAWKGQAGLYHLIQNLGLGVQTIIQGWPLSGYNVITTIPFTKLEESVRVL